MKLTISLALGLSIMLPSLSTAQTKDDEGHVLVKLWSEYKKAHDNDRPKDEMAILRQIKDQASAQKLAWDFYDAGSKYASTGSRMNWKLRDSLDSAFGKELAGFSEPIAWFYHNSYNAIRRDYIETNKEKLTASRNSEFYKRDGRITRSVYSSVLVEQLKNDYEYAAWCILPGKELAGMFNDYPMHAFAEYKALGELPSGKEEATRAFVEKYKGRAAALLGEADLLQMRWNSLYRNEKSTSGQYEELAADCRDLNRRRDGFKGSEKAMVKNLKTADCLLEDMESKNVEADVTDGKLTVTLRNLESVTITLKKGSSKIYEKFLTNPVKSFYVEDKLLVQLPELADGNYTVTCRNGKTETEIAYDKFTLSASCRRNGDKYSVWAADYITGEPMEKVKVEYIDKNDKVLKSCDLNLKNGFAGLPASMNGLIGKDRYDSRLRIRSLKNTDRCSKPVCPFISHYDYTPDAARVQCMLITDRSAYNPDETLHFKAVLYKGVYSLEAVTGKQAEVILLDAEDKQVDSIRLTSNEFGSIDGSFVLKRGGRNGSYKINVKVDGRTVGYKDVTVDDFVLPTFDLVFDKQAPVREQGAPIIVGGTVKAYSGHSLRNAKVRYRIETNSGMTKSVDLTLDADGHFEIPVQDDKNLYWCNVKVTVTDVTGETLSFNRFVFLREEPVKRIETKYFFDELTNDDGTLKLRAVASDKTTWMLIEVFGEGGRFISGETRKVSPVNGRAETTIEYNMGPEDGLVANVSVMYFQDKQSYRHTSIVRKVDHRYDLPLSFTRFLDTTKPGAQYTFIIKTEAGVECAASIFDKSTERIHGNNWWRVRPDETPAPDIFYSSVCGTNDSYVRRAFRNESGMVMLSKATAYEAVPALEDAVERSGIGSSADEESSSAGGQEIELREDFATTIAWEPYLRSDDEGNISFTFTNADKLSTFYVQLFAHDAQMRNETLRREMLVTIPVKISLVEPRLLYEGDRYDTRIGLSSSMSKDLPGTLTVSYLAGADHRNSPVLKTVSTRVTVPAKGSLSYDAPVDAGGTDILGIKITFSPDEGDLGADGVFVTVPIKKAVQTLGESHSGVLLPGTDKEALIKSLRAEFSNMDGSRAVLKEISILDMVKEALPEEIDLNSENAIAVSRSLYAFHLCGKIGRSVEFNHEEAVKKLMACKGDDGGFAWFPGMSSSPVVTATVLQRLKGLGIVDEAAAVKYIDKQYFNRDKNRWWYCGLSLGAYLHVRSLFPEVPFGEKVDKDTRKEVKEYLTPTRERGLNGMIFSKARRLQTLENLLGSDAGVALAKKLGVTFGAKAKMQKSLAADVESLVQYSQKHKNGGCYYPNAVMPWRGLLETELDAHSSLCEIMDRNGHKEISDGIRIWIMLQKETQHWENEPGFIDAIARVLEGSPEILATSVVALSGEYSMPFKEIKAAGNGISIELSTARPDTLKVGDRITLTYRINNEENRSFVKLTIPYNAGLMPVEQLSGYRYYWGCYRNVLPDRIERWYEVYPEHITTVSEEFYVTRAGAFQCPATTIKCEYAPHYEANTVAPDVQIIK